MHIFANHVSVAQKSLCNYGKEYKIMQILFSARVQCNLQTSTLSSSFGSFMAEIISVVHERKRKFIFDL